MWCIDDVVSYINANKVNFTLHETIIWWNSSLFFFAGLREKSSREVEKVKVKLIRLLSGFQGGIYCNLTSS